MSKIEEEICRIFIGKGTLKGNFLPQVPVGLEEIRKQYQKLHLEEITESEFRMAGGVLSKKIDLLCVTPPIDGLEITQEVLIPKPLRLRSWLNLREKLKGRKVWIFEAKKRLNLTALGQVIAYKVLFEEDNPEVEVEGIGILCKETDPLLEHVCEKLNIKVYKV